MFTSNTSGMRSAAAVIALALLPMMSNGCSSSTSGYSGRYEAEMEGGKFRIDFEGGNKAKVSIVAPDGQAISHNCVYAINGTKMTFTTDEPMGAPMTLTIDGDTLTDGGVVYKKK